MTAISGITLDTLAEISSKHSALSAQHGEPGFYPHFTAFLLTKGLDDHSYSDVHNAWLARFRSDPTGKLEAEFSMKVSRLVAQAHFGDVRNMSGDTQEGVTLDTYAQLTVAMGKPGADPDALARQHGLQGIAHWQAVSAAWVAEMGRDTTHKLTMQYGQLYSKYAGPQFEQDMQEQTAALLASSRQRPSAPEEPRREQTNDELIGLLRAPDLGERFAAARTLAHRWDMGHERDPSLKAALACVPVLIEMVERHEEDQTSEAEEAVRQLKNLKQNSDDVRGSLQRCLNRAQEHLATLERAFAPIANQSVPERVPLQMKIGGYRSLIGDLTSALEDWRSASSMPSGSPSVHSAGVSTAYGSTAPFANSLPAMPSSAGLPKMAILAPVIVLLALAGGGFTWMRAKTRASASGPSTTTTSVASAPTSAHGGHAAAPPVTTATPAPTGTTAAAGAASAASAASAVASGAPHAKAGSGAPAASGKSGAKKRR